MTTTETRLPKALSWFVKGKGIHWVIRWRDTYWFTPKENSMYRNDGNYLYAEDDSPLQYEVSEKLEIYNPKSQEYELVSFKENAWIDRHGSYDERTYLRGLEEYVSIDYDSSDYVYCFNLPQYLKDKHSPELSLKANGWGDFELVVSGVTKRLNVFKDYKENQTLFWDDKENKGKEIKFFTYNQLYSFIQELNEEVSQLPIGSEYSLMYDKIVNGELSKEAFLKEIIK